ncbi:hypothetical protein TDB9533_04690 [Thalassocella blandensis]|nr:hypothetical protein TDB9533_04690 [Thalassocella blandensis]
MSGDSSVTRNRGISGSGQQIQNEGPAKKSAKNEPESAFASNMQAMQKLMGAKRDAGKLMAEKSGKEIPEMKPIKKSDIETFKQKIKEKDRSTSAESPRWKKIVSRMSNRKVEESKLDNRAEFKTPDGLLLASSKESKLYRMKELGGGTNKIANRTREFSHLNKDQDKQWVIAYVKNPIDTNLIDLKDEIDTLIKLSRSAEFSVKVPKPLDEENISASDVIFPIVDSEGKETLAVILEYNPGYEFDKKISPVDNMKKFLETIDCKESDIESMNSETAKSKLELVSNTINDLKEIRKAMGVLRGDKDPGASISDVGNHIYEDQKLIKKEWGDFQFFMNKDDGSLTIFDPQKSNESGTSNVPKINSMIGYLEGVSQRLNEKVK